MNIWFLSLVISALITAVLTLFGRADTCRSACKGNVAPEARYFQLVFLVPFWIAMLADWLQGPYVYALYESYGYTSHDIAILFVFGFGSSMLFGTFIGALADRFGRRLLSQVFCFLYFLSCLTKHTRAFWILLVGRVLGGIATSILFSSFESWMVGEHTARRLDSELLSETFSIMFFGNFLVAIFAGLMAEAAVDSVPLKRLADSVPFDASNITDLDDQISTLYYGGNLMAFDLSAVVLILAFILISCLWNENYGNAGSAYTSKSACVEFRRKPGPIVVCGVIVSCFESAMYIFIFNWTPTLTNNFAVEVPFGLIFSIMMVCCMGGSSLFSILSNYLDVTIILAGVLAVAAVALAVPIFTLQQGLVFAGFLIFEACVGLYWPSIGYMKSEIVPESARATIYNIYRVPLNLIVIVVLLWQNMSIKVAFLICTMMLALSTICQVFLIGFDKHPKDEEANEDSESLTASE